jgi:hypothetical protein
MALVIAIVLLALASALLVGTVAAATAAARAERSARAAARADALARRVLGDFVLAWQPGFDSLPVGGAVARALSSLAGDDGFPAEGDVHLVRIGASLFAVTSEIRVGHADAIVARRRYRLLLEQRTNDSGVAPSGAPRRIPRWGLEELY